MRFIISTNVWGEKYVNKFLTVGVETLLREIQGLNLNKNIIKFSIHTDLQSNELITNELNKRLERSKNVEIEISNIEILNHEKLYKHILGYDIGKYNIHSIASNKEIIHAKDDDVIIFNYADFIWGSGSLKNLVSLFEDNSNHDLVLNHPLTIDESELKSLKATIHSKHGLNNSEITKKSISSAKWWYDEFEWLNHRGSSYQSLIYWPIDERKQSYIFRGFHLNLLAIRKKLHNGNTIPQIAIGTLDGSYYPWQLQPLEPNSYFISDLNFINIAASAKKSDDLGSINKFGHYIGNLQRNARKQFGKNEQVSLKEVLIISAEELSPNVVENMKEITYQHLKPILDMDLPIINTIDLNGLILSRSLIAKTEKVGILFLSVKFMFVLLLVRSPYFILKIFTDLLFYSIWRVARILSRLGEFLKLELIILKKRFLQNSYKSASFEDMPLIPESKERKTQNFDVNFTILRAVYRSTNIFFEEEKARVDLLISKIDTFLEDSIEKKIERINNFKD